MLHTLALASLVTLTFASFTSVALADPADDVELHVNGGLEITGGEGAVGVGFRGRAAIGKAFGGGSVRPSLSIGAMFGAGSVHVDDLRALDGDLAIGYRSYGPEAQVAMRFVDGGSADSRIFGSFALLRVDLDPRLMYDRVAGVSGSGHTGMRASLGANWADRIGGVAVEQGGSGTKRECRMHRAVLLLPQQVEAVWEREAGSNRYGVLFSYGI